jgi:hypothetical protein
MTHQDSPGWVGSIFFLDGAFLELLTQLVMDLVSLNIHME